MSHRAAVPLTSIVLALAMAPACGGTRDGLSGYVPDAAGAAGRAGADGTTPTGEGGATGSAGETGGGGSGTATGAAGAGGAGTDPDAGSGGAAGAGDGGIAPDATPDPTIPRDIDGRITINELMASNALTAADDAGQVGDWVEL